LHTEELRKIFCLENAMGGVGVHSCSWKGRDCFGRNKSRLRVDNVRAVVTQDAVVTCNRKQQSCESCRFVVDNVRAVVTQDAVVTCNRKQQSCESCRFVVVRLQIASLWKCAWRSRVEGQGVVFVLSLCCVCVCVESVSQSVRAEQNTLAGCVLLFNP